MLASSAVGCEFEIGIWCFSAKHAALRIISQMNRNLVGSTCGRFCFLWHNKGEHKFAKTCVKKCRCACTVYSMFKWRLPMGETQKLCALKLICTFLLMTWVIQLGNAPQAQPMSL
jgi:glycerol uptake facilitator-like aquaporin